MADGACIAANLARLRLDKDLTQEGLALKAGLSRVALGRIGRGAVLQRDSFFSLSVGQRDGGPAVVVNTWDRISVERWIFTAAHELGHLLLHPHEYQRGVTALPEDAEREADEFASEFLMPDQAFEREWDATRGALVACSRAEVKRILRLSYKTVLYRLVQSGSETSKVWQAFQSQHRDHFRKTLRKADEPRAIGKSEFAWSWGRAGEPAGLTRHDFMEDRLRRLVRFAVKRGRISLGRTTEILGRHRTRTPAWNRNRRIIS